MARVCFGGKSTPVSSDFRLGFLENDYFLISREFQGIPGFSRDSPGKSKRVVVVVVVVIVVSS